MDMVCEGISVTTSSALGGSAGFKGACWGQIHAVELPHRRTLRAVHQEPDPAGHQQRSRQAGAGSSG